MEVEKTQDERITEDLALGQQNIKDMDTTAKLVVPKEFTQEEEDAMAKRMESQAKQMRDFLITTALEENYYRVNCGNYTTLLRREQLPHPVMNCVCGSGEAFSKCCLKYNINDPQLPYRQFIPSRNDPCFCGSEKKFKKCCGSQGA